MSPRRERNILFLCTGNHYRSRFAEILFNSLAGKMGLHWKATSRGLALERGVNNVGPMSVSAIEALDARGVRAVADCARFPMQVKVNDLAAANWIVALKQTEHLPLLQERFPVWVGLGSPRKVEFWQVDDAPEVLGLIEVEVLDLASVAQAARLIGGGKKR